MRKKRLISTLLIAFISFLFSSSYASDVSTEIQGKGIAIINAILWIGYAIALGMVIFIGIKYMLGAADAKANMKSAVTNWIIGAFIVFMATTIVGIVLNTIGTSPDADSHSMAEELINKAREVSR
ncbi:MAG: TrbC/VirB2 family protein [Clostridia bacterium]|nr:TrbC/VirB2 family protein [Clostridia bacterium]